MNVYYKIAKVLTIVGGLNWGLVGVTNLFGSHFDLVEWIGYTLLNAPEVSYVLYTIVGLAALVVLVGMMNRK